jgi:hypothetical protein
MAAEVIKPSDRSDLVYGHAGIYRNLPAELKSIKSWSLDLPCEVDENRM